MESRPDKKAILKLFQDQIAASLAVLVQAANAAHEAATHAESKAEDQYDTRGLEASYLAGAQSRRALELEQAITLFRHLDVAQFDEKSTIAATALVELRDGEKASWYYLLPLGGGLKAEFEGKTIQTITPQSPLGGAILGRRQGDEVQIQIQNKTRDYEIVGVW